MPSVFNIQKFYLNKSFFSNLGIQIIIILSFLSIYVLQTDVKGSNLKYKNILGPIFWILISITTGLSLFILVTSLFLDFYSQKLLRYKYGKYYSNQTNIDKSNNLKSSFVPNQSNNYDSIKSSSFSTIDESHIGYISSISSYNSSVFHTHANVINSVIHDNDIQINQYENYTIKNENNDNNINTDNDDITINSYNINEDNYDKYNSFYNYNNKNLYFAHPDSSNLFVNRIMYINSKYFIMKCQRKIVYFYFCVLFLFSLCLSLMSFFILRIYIAYFVSIFIFTFALLWSYKIYNLYKYFFPNHNKIQNKKTSIKKDKEKKKNNSEKDKENNAANNLDSKITNNSTDQSEYNKYIGTEYEVSEHSLNDIDFDIGFSIGPYNFSSPSKHPESPSKIGKLTKENLEELTEDFQDDSTFSLFNSKSKSGSIIFNKIRKKSSIKIKKNSGSISSKKSKADSIDKSDNESVETGSIAASHHSDAWYNISDSEDDNSVGRSSVYSHNSLFQHYNSRSASFASVDSNSHNNSQSFSSQTAQSNFSILRSNRFSISSFSFSSNSNKNTINKPINTISNINSLRVGFVIPSSIKILAPNSFRKLPGGNLDLLVISHGRKTWKTFYFVLHNGRQLSYYINELTYEKDPLQTVNKIPIELEDFVIEASSHEPPFDITLVPIRINNSQNVHYNTELHRDIIELRCSSYDEHLEWVTLLYAALQFCHEMAQNESYNFENVT